MSDSMRNALDAAKLRRSALSRWDNEGGAILDGHREGLDSGTGQPEDPALTNSKFVQLRVGIIALQNLGIA
jgi:hypothetical protein